MNLDESTSFAEVDKKDMLSHIDDLPDQLANAWRLGKQFDLPNWKGIQQILLTGMGGSAIGADFLAAYAASNCRIPIVVHRDYDLPVWAAGPHTLVIASSHSGNTEETLATFLAALERRCQCLAVTTDGKLEQIARDARAPIWKFEHTGQPRAAVGFSFGLLLAVMRRLDLVADPQTELDSAVEAMKRQQEKLLAQIPVVHNPAKRYAGQLMGRWVTVIGSGVLAPVARRWKTQINELAKAWSQFEFLPEADHNTLAGILEPENSLTNLMAIFLRSPSDHPRNRLRSDLTRKAFMQQGINTDFVDAQGSNPLSHLWTCLHFGDYLAYYLAIAYGNDPTPVAAIETFKREMSAAE
jgi:glucose/mannose-6-phosphate isomerase